MAHDNTENVTEIVGFYDFQLNEAEAATFGVTKGLDGCVRSYHGLEAHPDGNGIWVQEWLLLAHHTAFQNSAIYSSFTARVGSFANTQRIDIMHVQLRPYPAECAFTAPLTEMTVATLKPTSTVGDFDAVMQEPSVRSLGLSYGAILECETRRQYFIAIGWDSTKERQESLSRANWFKELNEIAELNTKLYDLTE